MNKENKSPKIRSPTFMVAPKATSKCQNCRNPQPVYRTCFKCNTSSMYFCAEEDCWGILNAMKHSNSSRPMWVCLNCSPKPLNLEEKKFWLPAPNESVDRRIEEEILDAMSTSVYGEENLLKLEKNEEDAESMGFVSVDLKGEEEKLEKKKRSPFCPVRNVKISLKDEISDLPGTALRRYCV